jgi:hypothetical protein
VLKYVKSLVMANPKDNIPAQTEGEKTDVIHFVDTPSREQAHHLFLLAKDRLKNIPQWHTFSGPASAEFFMTDAQGNVIYKNAEVGDLFYIDIPGPGPFAGGGFEWVRIEAMTEVDDPDAETEYLTLTVRPIVNPRDPEKGIAHFFDHNSTNTFIIERYNNRVNAAVHGRNETPNTTGTGLFDTVRNTILALTARNKVSVMQWKAFVTGILDS